MANKKSYQIATILSGATTSDIIDLEDRILCGFFMPAAFTGTALTITSSDTSTGTYTTAYMGGADQSIVVTTSKNVDLVPANFAGLGQYIKIVSDGAEGANRQIKVISREIG